MTRVFPLLLAALVLLPIAGLSAPPSVALRDVDGVLRRPLDVGAGQKAAVLIFIADDCPISNGYAPEINRLQAAFGPQKIAFYLISADQGASPAAVKQHAAQYAFRCPDLLDPQHTLVKQLGATVTPEAFVFGPGGKLLYHGRIDDKYADFGRVRFAPTSHDLRDALDAVVSGSPVPHARTKAVGCFL